MIHERRRFAIPDSLADGFATQKPYDYLAFLSAVRRYQIWLVTWIMLCVGLATVYLVLTPAEYIASTQVILQTPKSDRGTIPGESSRSLQIDSAQVESQIQVIQSERLLRFVFNLLHEDKKMQRPAFGLRDLILSMFRHGPELSASMIETKAFLAFQERVSARRVALSYVIDISFRARTPLEAASTANSITAAFIRDQILSGPTDGEVLQRRILENTQSAKLLLDAVTTGTIPSDVTSGGYARVISTAIAPLARSSPNIPLTLLFACCVALTTAMGVILFIQSRDRYLRSERQVKKMFGQELLAVLPRNFFHPRKHYSRAKVLHKILNALPEQEAGHASIGFVSWTRTSATTSLASSLADLLKETGAVTLLEAHVGPYDMKEQEDLPALVARADTQRTDDALRVDAFATTFERESRGWLSREELRKSTIVSLQTRGHLVLDLPPLESSTAAKSFGPLLDGVVLVLEKDRSTIDDVPAMLALLGASRVLGVVFCLRALPVRRRTARRSRSRRSMGLAASPGLQS